jgi:NADH:ubiquinone oxidoreductase subunit C
MTEELHRALAELAGCPAEEFTANTLVPAAAHHTFAEHLKADGFDIYITVVATHWAAVEATEKLPDGTPECFEVATVLRRSDDGESISWRVALDASAQIASLVDLFEGADWQEREQYDLVGVTFSNHPDLRRLMMPEDWPGHPLRKDYAIDTSHHPWR